MSNETIQNGTNITIYIDEGAADADGIINVSKMFNNSDVAEIDVQLGEKSDKKSLNLVNFAANSPNLTILNINKFINATDGTGLVEGSTQAKVNIPGCLSDDKIYGTNSSINCIEGNTIIYQDNYYPIENDIF